MLTKKNIGIFKALFAVIVWGGSFVATKIALKSLVPDTLVMLRFSMGVLILGMAVIWKRLLRLPDRRELPYLALLGFLGITLHQWLQSTGLVTSQATTTSWIVASIPVFMALLGWLFLHEKLGWLRWLGIFLASLGVLLVVTRGDLRSLLNGKAGTIGDLLVLASAPNWALFSVLSRRGLKKYPATLMMFYVMGFGWLFSSSLFLAGGNVNGIPSIPWDGWIAICFLGIFCSGLAYIYWYEALQVLPVTQTGVFLYLEPLVTVVLAIILLGESISPAVVMGGGLIFSGVWLVSRGTGMES